MTASRKATADERAAAAQRATGDERATAATATTGGILRPDEQARHVELVRRPAAPEASRWVENQWSLAWDLAAGRAFSSHVLAHPTCSLTVERGSHPRSELPAGQALVVTGVATRRFDVEISGWGRVVGLRFRPGGLAELTGRSAAAWTNRVVPALDLLPADLCRTLADPHLSDQPDDWAAAAQAGLAAMAMTHEHAPGHGGINRSQSSPVLFAGRRTARDRTDQSHSERYDLLLGVIADMLADRCLIAVAEVAGRHGVTVRALQRLFTHYVGAGPKWVLGRYRMHDVVTELDDGYAGTLTDLAYRYGWYDQAHSTRDFAALVGLTPGQYRDRPVQ